MRIRFLGTAAAEGFPALFCHCDSCTKARERKGKNIRRRCAYLLDDDTMVDFGPDIYWQSVEFGIHLEKIRRLLISHSHYDHINVPELQWRAKCFVKVDDDLKVYANQATWDKFNVGIEGFFAEGYRISPHLVLPGEAYTDDDLSFTAIRAQHFRPPELALNYVIQRNGVTALIGHDSGWWPEESWNILQNFRLDILVIEGTSGFLWPDDQDYHMGINADIRLRDELLRRGILKEDAQVVVTHFSHNGSPLQEELEAFFSPHGIQVAYDGMVVER